MAQVLGRKNAVLDALDRILADEFLLYAKTRGYHWNVEGPHFAQLHALFEKQYRELSEVVDLVAERSRALGRYALGSLEEFSRFSKLREAAGKVRGWKAMVEDLRLDHEAVAERLGEGIAAAEDAGDIPTMDMLAGLQEKHQKTAWMLRSILANGKG